MATVHRVIESDTTKQVMLSLHLIIRRSRRGISKYTEIGVTSRSQPESAEVSVEVHGEFEWSAGTWALFQGFRVMGFISQIRRVLKIIMLAQRCA